VSVRLEDYAIIGDTETVALVSRSGSIDWLCLPRFDSGACFAALLGDESNGRWALTPVGSPRAVRRRYRPGTLVLETEFDCDGGTVRIVDSMPPRGLEGGDNPDVVRVVEGVSGRVAMRMVLTIRFDYGWVVPWVSRRGRCLHAVAGPDRLVLTTPVALRGEGLSTVAEFEVAEGDQVPFVLTWHPSHQPVLEPVDATKSTANTTAWWRQWSARSTYRGEYQDAVGRSLITLKALTYAPTGGVVAAATTSLPERLGSSRNWDYRFVWLRDATFTLQALMLAGYRQEALAWRDWLLRAVAGDPPRLQIMYGIAGERRLTEFELPWLPGYEGSSPVRIGNGAYDQMQLDVYGEVMDALHYARRTGMEADHASWSLQRALLEHLERTWSQLDHGIWEMRGPKRAFTHSRVMAWVAFDRAIKSVENSGLHGPVDRWRGLRDEIHVEVLAEGFDADRNTFTQSYGSRELDASLLLIPQMGFLPAHDARVRGTVDAVQRELGRGDGLLLRYRTEVSDDGLPHGEGAFLLCSFWLVDALAMIGRRDEARRTFERLLEVRNDVGLLAEEYDAVADRMLGNFPQAFSHLGLVSSAYNLGAGAGPADQRSDDTRTTSP
jgi:GH15 family glucan-1,4-alpha-glucosidase